MSSYCHDRAALHTKWFQKEAKGLKRKKGPNAWKDMMDTMTWPQIHETYNEVSKYSTSGISGPDFQHLKSIIQEYALGGPRKKRGKQSKQDKTDLAAFTTVILEDTKPKSRIKMEGLKFVSMKMITPDGDQVPLPWEERSSSQSTPWPTFQQAQPLPGPLSWDKYNISQQPSQDQSPTQEIGSPTLRLSQMYSSQDNDDEK